MRHYRIRSPSDRAVDKLEIRVDDGLHKTITRPPLNNRLTTDELPQRNVIVTLLAYSGDPPSLPVSFALQWEGATSTVARKPNLYAVVVGAGNYSSNDGQ